MDNKTFKQLAINQKWDILSSITNNVLSDFVKNEKKIIDVDNEKVKLLSEEDKSTIYYFYQDFKDDIELFCANRGKTGTIYYKSLLALRTHFYIRDKRTIKQWVENVVVNWEFEDKLIIALQELDLVVSKQGNDKDRKLSLFNFSAAPDLSITKNGKTFLVEVQQGYNRFLKQNKIDSLIKTNSYLLYFSTENELYYLFDKKELLAINGTENVVAYQDKNGNGGKNGKVFNLEDYAFSSLKEQFEKI